MAVPVRTYGDGILIITGDYVRGQDAVGGSGLAGSTLNMRGGAGDGVGDGGGVLVDGGSAGASANAGGGSITLQATDSAATGTGNGGSVILIPGIAQDTGADGYVQIDSAAADTEELLKLDNSDGTNGAITDVHTGTRDPNAAAISGVRGSIYLRNPGGGAAGEFWVNTSTTDPGTNWTNVTAGGGGESLAATLVIGNTTGGTDIEVSGGDSIISSVGTDLTLAPAAGQEAVVTLDFRVNGTAFLGTPGGAAAHEVFGTSMSYADNDTNVTSKSFRQLGRPYTNAHGEWVATNFLGLSSNNELRLGGHPSLDSSTLITFYTATGLNTSGTLRGSCDSGGTWTFGASGVGTDHVMFGDGLVVSDISTDAAIKQFDFKARPFTNAEGNWAFITAYADASKNILFLGGQPIDDAATEIQIYTASALDTTGTLHGVIDNGGTLTWENDIVIGSSLAADTSPIIELDNGGTNGAITDIHTGTRDPNAAAISGVRGSIYLRNPGGGSAGQLWVNTSTTDPGTTWTNVTAGTQSWSSTLAIGNTSGANNPSIDNGQSIISTDSTVANGGSYTIRAGNITGGAAAVNGGALTVRGGDNASSNGAAVGGTLTVRGGDYSGAGGGAGGGGALTVRGGDATGVGASAIGGSLTLRAGDAKGNAYNGANLTMRAGNAESTATGAGGGSLSITGGAGGASGNGGAITITGGAAGAANSNGGGVTITATGSTGVGVDGTLSLRASRRGTTATAVVEIDTITGTYANSGWRHMTLGHEATAGAGPTTVLTIPAGATNGTNLKLRVWVTASNNNFAGRQLSQILERTFRRSGGTWAQFSADHRNSIINDGGWVATDVVTTTISGNNINVRVTPPTTDPSRWMLEIDWQRGGMAA